jgi:glycosyltransferase involved in cell wall biosynthesis
MQVTVRVGISGDAPDGAASSRRFLDLHSPPGLRVSLLASSGGRAFNELAAFTDTAVVVLIESGALVGPRWLEPLLAALARPGVGLAGPSTNHCWNEQGCLPGSQGGHLAGVRRDATRARARFGGAVRSLAPLHSLAGFCYAVHRDVIDRIGVADEAFGDGPCWEMDYNIRAARAGFAGLWVGASYVHRDPARVDDAGALDRARRLYQDRWCRLQHEEVRPDYQPHCRGEDCEHFAPTGLSAGTIPLAAPPAPTRAAPAPAAAVRPLPDPDPPAPAVVGSGRPLVSCLMVTRDRREFALRAVEHFLRQDYPERELVVVEDGAPGLAAVLPDDPRIRLVPAGRSRTIGALRNESCAQARGSVVVLWDDDDWHAPGRVSAQVEPILDGRADMTGLTDLTWLDIDSWQAWQLDRSAQERMLLQRVYAGTLAFRREIWQEQATFADRSLAEDAAFLRDAVRRGARLGRINGQRLYVYVRHGQNSWQVEPGRTGVPRGWRRAALPDLPAEELAFLRNRAVGAPATVPLISCIMPTYDRRRYVGQAIHYFLRQTYPNRELIVVDDGTDSVADLVADLPDGSRVRHHRLDQRMVLGAKRNLACSLAEGELIAHWDDDDWQARDRLAVQTARLLSTGASVCGMSAIEFYAPDRKQAWHYRWPSHRRPWLAGTSLLYTRRLWQRVPFAEVATGEDTRFVWRAVDSGVVSSKASSVIGIVHPGNTVPKNGKGTYWRAIDNSGVQMTMAEDLDFYELSAGLATSTLDASGQT